MNGLMNIKELSAYIGVPINTIYRWRVHQQGPRAVRLGRALHWRVEEVERWLDAHTEAQQDSGRH